MREIKFRAWDKKDKEMASPSTLIELFDQAKYFDISYIAKSMLWMQYTGLKDKNGKEIYEGDIVRHIDVCRDETVFDVKYGDVGCDYHGGIGFAMSTENPSNESEDFEVIGNIYESPELLADPTT